MSRGGAIGVAEGHDTLIMSFSFAPWNGANFLESPAMSNFEENSSSIAGKVTNDGASDWLVGSDARPSSRPKVGMKSKVPVAQSLPVTV